MSGTMDIVLAGGVESMTRVPLSSAIKLAVDNGYDHPDSPRVRARYAGAELNQFAGAEAIAARYEISREMLDRFGFESHRRAVQAATSGAFEQERSEEHTSELQSLMRISYAVFCLKKKNTSTHTNSRQ